jgi:glycosyltransferase involved in cell wall biosynthesis
MPRSGLVIAHGSSTLAACALAGLGTGVPFIYRQISDSLFWAPTWFRRARVRAGLRRAAAVVALWPGSARVLQRHFAVPPRKVTVVPNGVPITRLTARPDCADELARPGLPPDVVVLLYVGALVPEKGVDTAIETCGLLPDAHLVVAGDGPQRRDLQALADAVAPGRVHFLGSVEDPAPLYREADVLVLPSRGGDSMPAVLIEAGMLGVPAVSTAVQAIVDVVLDGVTGRIVPSGSPEALTEGIQDVLAHAHSYGAAARRHCLEHFEIEVCADGWDRVIREVIAAHSPRG